MNRDGDSDKISGATGAAREPEATQTTMEERLALVWRLTLESWAAAGNGIDPEPRIQRDIVRIIRGQR